MQDAVRIALCESVTLSDGDAAAVIRESAEAHGFDAVTISACASALDLADSVVRSAQNPALELTIVDIDRAEQSGIELLREVRDADPVMSIVIVAGDASVAKEAISIDAAAYLLKPLTTQALQAALERCWPRIEKRRASYVELRFRDRVRSIDPGSIIYAETADHDQLVHFTNGESYATRSSSQGLFDQLSHDMRFFKAGSSFILNLDHVRFFSSDGEATLDTGETITVPVRLRKSLEAALFDASA